MLTAELAVGFGIRPVTNQSDPGQPGAPQLRTGVS